MKTQERNATPGRSSLDSASAYESASMYGAPINSNGRVVPRPSDICVPSRCTLPGNTEAESSVGIFGEGKTQGPSVSSNQSSRDQPFIVTVSKSQSMPNASLKSLPSSHMVIPWRVAIGDCPTNEANAGSRTTPSTSVPPIGFCRSHAITLLPNFLAPRMQFAIVYMNV